MNIVPKRITVTLVCNYCGHEMTIRIKEESNPHDAAFWSQCPSCQKYEMTVKE